MFKLEIDTSNDAFKQGVAAELEDILRALDVPDYGEGIIKDSNGNTVGHMTLTDSVEEIEADASKEHPLKD